MTKIGWGGEVSQRDKAELVGIQNKNTVQKEKSKDRQGKKGRTKGKGHRDEVGEDK